MAPANANDYAELAADTADVAVRAGDLLLQYRDDLSQLSIHDKAEDGGTQDLVTTADHAADALLADELKILARVPYWSEETGEMPDTDAYWLVDPLDGTNNFVNGLPLYGVSIAFMEGGRPRAAACHFPGIDLTVWASEGGGTWCGGHPIRLENRPQADWVVEVNAQPRDPEQIANLRRLAAGVRAVRVFGSIALSMSWVAAGRLDLFVGRGYPWDVAAGMLLVREAGGVNWTAPETARDPLRVEMMVCGAPASVRAALDQIHRPSE